MNYYILTIVCLLFANNTAAKVITVNNESELLSYSTKAPTVIKVSTTWCPPCQRIKKPYEDFSEKSEFSHINFLHIDGDTQDATLEKFCNDGFPTFFFMQGDKILQKKNFGPNDFTNGTVAKIIDTTFKKTEEGKIIENGKKEEKKNEEQPQPQKSSSFMESIKQFFSSTIEHIKEFFLSIYNSLYSFFTCKK